MGFLFLLASLAVQLALMDASPVARAIDSLPIINTTYGYVKGTYSPYRDGVTVYKGIPYANTTAGENRWKAPQATSWDGVLNATTFGLMCAQMPSSAGIFSTDSTQYSEDCLTLNIWTPAYNDTADVSQKNLAVYFWIFGGRFEGGSGDVKTYDGSGLASKDIIVVTINYRLGPFGFLAHPELSTESGHNSSGNYGLLDQQFALKWVKDNIGSFGGNPDQITVGGQSAGSASALDMMYSPLSSDMVAGVISESGARAPHDPLTGGLATSYRTKAQAEADGVSFLKTMNVTSIAELRTLSTAALVAEDSLSDTTYDNTSLAAVSGAFSNPPLWRPIIDGYVLTHTYGDALALNVHGDVPILTGGNKDESGASPDPGFNRSSYNTDFSSVFQNFSTEFFTLYPASNDTQANDMNNALFRDLNRLSPWLWAKAWSAGGATSNVYLYYWTRDPAENSGQGAYHGSELWYTFNNIPYSDFSNVTWQAYDYQVEDRMSTYWANFIKTGDPNGGNLTEFPAFSSDSQQTMWLGETFGSSYLTESAKRMAFLESWMSTLHEW